MFAVVVSMHAMLLVLSVAGLPAHHQVEARQSSDGCGPNPLVAVISYAREFADFSPYQLMRFIESDTKAGSQLRSLLRTYDDCVRTGDGARYKKSSSVAEMMFNDDVDLVSDPNTSVPRMIGVNKQHSLQQANQSLLRALASHKLL
ncbi:uncharacterized protein LOC130696293 [Daphnia carinata]|uniref:uncharacterized protein LOC130696293 n=1 Tax=Daphnia carinata TaxID=120202 RepID=UPI00257CB2C3|nr:uncharacterized protein LOC130696293 [Daphnia carinata]